MTERLTNPDEIVLEDVKMFHLEQMNETAYWCGITLNGGRYFHLNIHGDNLRVYWSEETPDELAQGLPKVPPDAL
jgi:hypothetical protein